MNLGDRIKTVIIGMFLISGKSRLSNWHLVSNRHYKNVCCTDGRVWLSSSAVKADIIRKMSWTDLRYVQHKLVSKAVLNRKFYTVF